VRRLDIRVALMQKLQGTSTNELKQLISDGINSNEETILPGLGVLFEQYYNSLDEGKKDSLLQDISSLLK
jgi:small acid-soluble spore protein I (minor)